MIFLEDVVFENDEDLMRDRGDPYYRRTSSDGMIRVRMKFTCTHEEAMRFADFMRAQYGGDSGGSIPEPARELPSPTRVLPSPARERALPNSMMIEGEFEDD